MTWAMVTIGCLLGAVVMLCIIVRGNEKRIEKLEEKIKKILKEK